LHFLFLNSRDRLRTANPKTADRKFCTPNQRTPEHNCGPQLCPAAPFQPFFFSKQSLHLPHPSNSSKIKNTSSHPTHTTFSSTLSTTSTSSPPQPLLDTSNHFFSSTLAILPSQNPRCAPQPNPPSPNHHSHSPAYRTPNLPILHQFLRSATQKLRSDKFFHQNPTCPHTSYNRHACQENIRWP
jgi:hypothetical protein